MASWEVLETLSHVSPPMRSKSASVLCESKLFVFGGLGAGPTGELWCFDLATSRWSTLASGPQARSGHSLMCDEEAKKIWLFGGQGLGKKTDVKSPQTSILVIQTKFQRWV